MTKQKQNIYKIKISKFVNVLAYSADEAIERIIKSKNINISEFIDKIQNLTRLKKNGKK